MFEVAWCEERLLVEAEREAMSGWSRPGEVEVETSLLDALEVKWAFFALLLLFEALLCDWIIK